ncbi:hypothetical protein BC941DRAFT_439707 [Chlamydoabsidia padenii]|nr:hypothetical protein BC941DRAFT_439707 [Chlamydoabsidia padenii]
MTDKVTAHHDYEAQQDDELSFQAGDLITVTDHSNADWWMGTKEKDGKSGFFPSNFVEAYQEKQVLATEEESKKQEEKQQEETPEPPQPIGRARVMEDYAMQQDDELTLHKGGIVLLYEKDGDWLVGEINGKQGRFPAKYVEEIDMPSGVRPDLGTPGDAGGFKLAAFGVKQGGIGSLLAGGIPTLKKTVKSPTKEEGPTPVIPTTSSPATPPVIPTTAAATEEQNKPLTKAIVLHPYDAENDDELTLIRGEYIDILDRQADDGWWQGRNEKNQLGVFPSNFVKEIDLQQQAPTIRSRQSVAGNRSSPVVVDSSSRPFSTPTPSLQNSQPSPVQRLPPLPDTKVDTPKEDIDALEFNGTPVGDSAPTDINTPDIKTDSSKVESPKAESLKTDTPKVESPKAESLKTDTPKVESPKVEESQEIKADTQEKKTETPVVPVPDIAILDQQEDQPVKNQQSEQQSSSAPSELTKEEHDTKHEEKETAAIPTETQGNANNVSHVEEESAPVEEPNTSAEETPVEETPVEEPTTTGTDIASDSMDDSSKKGLGLDMPITGPRLVSPNRAGRPSTRPRRPPTMHNDTPSQTELLQQEIEKTPEEETAPSSPPPKPVKPIFAKFPTPFAMGGGSEGVSTKHLKPVQRRMFEPVPAHEPTSPPTNEDNNDRPVTGGVRGLASRFAGLPGGGGGNEVMETKLKNFTKNEVEKVRKELAEERARVDTLESLVKSLQAQIEQLLEHN